MAGSPARRERRWGVEVPRPGHPEEGAGERKEGAEGLAPSGLPAHAIGQKFQHVTGRAVPLKPCAHNGQRALRGCFSRAQAGADWHREPRAPPELRTPRAPTTPTPRPLNEASRCPLAARSAPPEVRSLRGGWCAGRPCAHLPACAPWGSPGTSASFCWRPTEATHRTKTSHRNGTRRGW